MATNDTIINIPNGHGQVEYTEKEKPEYIVSEVEVKGASPKRPAYRRRQTGRRQLDRTESNDSQHPIDYDGEEDALKWLGRFYHQVLNFNIVTRYVVYLFPVSLALAIPLIIFGTVAKNANAHGVKLFGLFIWLEIVWASLWICKLLAKTLPPIFQFLCGMVSAGTRKYGELIKALELQISFFVWVVVTWATVPVIELFDMRHLEAPVDITVPGHEWPHTLQRVLLASIPVAGVWFIEKLAVQLICVNYHRTQFARKIKESNHMIEVFTKLYKASRTLFEPFCEDFMEEDLLIHSSLVGSNASREARTVLGGIARVGNGVTSVFNSIASEVAGGRKLDPNSDKGVVVTALQKKASSAALGRRLWMSLAEAGKDALYEKDLIRVLGEDKLHDAEMMFRHLDTDRNGDISLDEMESMLIAFEKSQKAMLRSMHDVKTSVAALDRILMAAALVLSAGIYAAFFSKDFLKNLAIATTSIMSFSFAFAGTVQEFAGSCIFIFVKHPYDCDDRVDINGVEMIVQHISLLYTVFLRVDTNRTVQIPNIVNNSNWIENVSRSGAMKERIEISIDASTSAEDIQALHDELKAFVLLPDCKRDYHPLVLVDVNAIDDFKSLQLRIEYSHKSNWADEMLRLTRRTKFLTAVIAALRRVPISAPGCAAPALGSRELPTYSVPCTDIDAKAAKAQFDEAKQAARLVNQQKNANVSTHVEEVADLHQTSAGRRPSAVEDTHLRTEQDPAGRRRSSEFRGVRAADASLSNPRGSVTSYQ